MEDNNKQIPEDILKFSKDAIPILEKYGLLKKDFNFAPIIIISSCIIMLSFILVFYYGISNDKFKSDVLQNVSFDFETNMTSIDNNLYNFMPETDNTFKNNFTIINYVNCP